MKHCHVDTYHTDNFCGHCGETVEKAHYATLEEVNPEIFVDVKPYYPLAHAITGEVKSAYYYTRSSGSKRTETIQGYWWIEVVDRNNVAHSTSILAESDYMADITRGDIITLFLPEEHTLSSRICEQDAEKIVTHNQLAPCVFVHLETEQRQSIVPALSHAPKVAFTVVWPLITLLIFILSLWLFSLTFQGAGMLAIVTGVTFGFYESARNKAKDHQAQDKHNALLRTNAKILAISKFKLGYANLERDQDDNDVLCIHCAKRVPLSCGFCLYCGNKNTSKIDATIDETADIATLSAQADLLLSSKVSHHASLEMVEPVTSATDQ
ncbi:hypothetical protein RCJ22_38150 [Vibrio sp. FNV 38]|nr:hypothetical protein [Vibrio sp. FNV 38]